MTHTKRTLKIVCLHGYCQNGQQLRRKTGALRKTLERNVYTIRKAAGIAGDDGTNSDAIPLAELFYLDAPFLLEDRLNAGGGTATSESDKFVSVYSPVRMATGLPSETPLVDRSRRSWWHAEDNGRRYVGWDKSLEMLKTAFKHNKFDGVLGFSQGSIVASLLCALQEQATETSAFDSLRFALLYSGFTSRATEHQALYSRPLRTPSLHTWGVDDKFVPAATSKILLDKFAHAHAHQHAKGHLVPSDSASRTAASRFLLDVWDGRLLTPSRDSDDDGGNDGGNHGGNDGGNHDGNDDGNEDDDDAPPLRAAL